MCCHFTRLIVGLVTFVVGVGLASVWITRPHAERTYILTTTSRHDVALTAEPTAVTLESQPVESPEDKAVRLAEEHIAHNGYTDLPAERDKLSYEYVEWAANVDELLKFRHDTLERKAYGFLSRGRLGVKGGFTVVFRYRQRSGDVGDDEGFPMSKRGRAVTMDSDFQKLRVEHKDFPLSNVEKKL